MKISVLTGRNGQVIATVRNVRKAGSPTIGLIAKRGQSLHEIDLPTNLERQESGEQLHNALTEHLKKQRRSKKS